MSPSPHHHFTITYTQPSLTRSLTPSTPSSTSFPTAEVIETFDGTCGLDNLLSLHLNDSQGALGSRLDRHAHIGDGCCGDACFRAFLSHPTLISRPMILETAKEEAPDGRKWDEVNLDRLRALCPEGTMSR